MSLLGGEALFQEELERSEGASGLVVHLLGKDYHEVKLKGIPTFEVEKVEEGNQKIACELDVLVVEKFEVLRELRQNCAENLSLVVGLTILFFTTMKQ